MREQLYAAEANYILGYLDRIENATEEELKLASRMFADAPAVPDTFSRRTPGADEDDDPLDDIYEEEGDEARITVEGLLTMNGPSPIDRLFGDVGTSYKRIIAACNRASASACERITFAINSPGGEVNGADHTWQAIRALSSSKPCTAENYGIMASAAYWLASACQRITATSPACEQGSIGVKQVLIDDSGLRDAIGLKKITIVSKNAPRKSEDPSKKADLTEMQKRCDAVEAVFIARVSEGRGVSEKKVISDFGQGAVLISSEAKDAGMIDAIVAPRGIPKAFAPAITDPYRRTASAGLAASAETPAAPAAISESGRKHMTLKELLASDAAALAEYNAEMKAHFDAGKAEMQAVAKQVGKYLTSDIYSKSKAIVERSIKAMSGEGSAESVEAMVSMFDLMAEDKKQTLAIAETTAAGETPALKLEADAEVMAKAAALKINVEDLTARALAAKMDPAAALTAEIENQEMLIADHARTGV